MNPAQLLAHFDRISDAPGAIPRLRRFILDLAVRGKLVEQDPRDEPASELLKRTQLEKERLVKEGGIRKETVSPQLAEQNLFRVPDGWCWSRLADVGFINPRNTAADNLSASFVPMPLISTDYGVGSKHEVRPWAEIKSGYTHFADGDVALAKITPCFENGKSTVFRGLTGGVGAGTTELHVLRPIEISANYVLIFLKCAYFIESGIPRMTGTAGQKRIPTEYFAYTPFPLPPLAEQQRIVAKVDELMALCDRLEAAQAEREIRRDRLVTSSLTRLNNGAEPDAFHGHARFYFNHLPRLTTKPEHILQLRQTVLNLAVLGQLVSQDPNDEPASELLKRIQTEQEELIKARVLKLGGEDSRLLKDDFPCDIPPTWQWSTLRSIIVFGPQNGLSPKPSTRPDAPRAITLTATTSGKFNPQHLKRVEAIIPPDSEFWLRSGDFLFQRGNTREYVGIAAYYTGEPRLFLYPDLMMKVRLSQKVSLRYVHLWSIAPPAREYFSTHATGAQATMPKINQGTLLQLPVPIPPLAEQQRIVAKVDELMALCDKLEAQLTTTHTDSRRLLEAVLHEALAPAV